HVPHARRGPARSGRHALCVRLWSHVEWRGRQHRTLLEGGVPRSTRRAAAPLWSLHASWRIKPEVPGRGTYGGERASHTAARPDVNGSYSNAASSDGRREGRAQRSALFALRRARLSARLRSSISRLSTSMSANVR